MGLTIVELPIEQLRIDEVRFPAREDSYILDHLMYYLSLVYLLPAIQVRVEEDGPVVTERHKYLVAARRLGRTRIRAVVESASDPQRLMSLLSQPGVERVSRETIDDGPTAAAIVQQWHVYFFERPLSAAEKRDFEDTVARFFERLAGQYPADLYPAGPVVLELVHDDSKPLARFNVWVPVGDESWYAAYRASVLDFSAHRARIVSFQGQRL